MSDHYSTVASAAYVVGSAMKEPDWNIVGQIVVAVLVALVNEWRRRKSKPKKSLRPRKNSTL